MPTTTVSYLRGRARTVGQRMHDDDGATATEYGLLVAFIAFVVIAGVFALGTNLDTWFDNISEAVAGWNADNPGGGGGGEG